jgi:hypothetical protein
MNNILLVLILLLSLFNFFIVMKKDKKVVKVPVVNVPIVNVPIVKKPEPPIMPVPPAPVQSPTFTNYPPIAESKEKGVLADINSHVSNSFGGSDKITEAHENTHQINSDARNKFGQNRNAFYVLNNKIVLVSEPSTTIRAVASKVPSSLRGDVYNLYLVQQAGDWNDTPLYILDEWSAYLNGSACRLDEGITSRAETVKYSLEFAVYSICVAWESKSQDEQLKLFLIWQIERLMKIYKDSSHLGNLAFSDNYLNLIKTKEDAANFRSFCHQYFGSDWCKKILDF